MDVVDARLGWVNSALEQTIKSPKKYTQSL